MELLLDLFDENICLHNYSMQTAVSEYRYWNSADKPSSVSRKEWDRRAEAWDRVLGMEPLSTRGFVIDLHEIGGPFPQHKADQKRKQKGAS